MKSCMTYCASFAIISALTLSCASTTNTAKNTENQVETEQIQIQEEVLPPPPSASELFSQKINGLKLSLAASPKETTKTKAFASPYIIKAEDSEGKALESFEITVVYPSSRKTGNSAGAGKVIFAETVITTDAEGKAEFLPPTPEFSFNSEISFFPKYEKEGVEEAEISKISELAAQHTIKAPYKVQTNLKTAGGVIAIVDFNQNGKAITSNPISSSNLLMTLMKLGFVKIGNAPQDVTDAVIQNNEAKILSRAKPIAPTFIIYGTIAIDSYEKTEEGFTYTLTGSIKSMDSKNGEITFSTEMTISVTDKNDWNALSNARKNLADIIAAEIKYGI